MLILDVSNNNGHVDWAKVAKYGVKGAFGKASEGLGFTDGLFAENRAAARAHGIPFGAYHFAHPDNNALAEAKHFVSVVGKIKPGELRPVLDMETGHGTAEWIHTFNQYVLKHLGAGPLFYSYAAYIEGLGLKLPVGYGLWLASYGRNDGKDYPAVAPAPWKSFVLHQFTSNAIVPGVSGHADLSFARTLRPLRAPATV